ncbi:helix-turn-helix transcriptional regulator [Paenibacillus sp. HN-1]|uniref:helix-turn-helix domain-containing protein n=1 Tax=Paenibacillus TaxID=44249 RepID=UPI000F9D348E|nr:MULTISPECIES: helix-turn-helix transcriptional regulator [Paenibacillus]MBY9081244.1 helix-turn-helix transcriptional regulator [Paenibacillus sp. CGMCC 1.18879]MBY9087281.1 helix-turn-helix transcriptional regulator [Paenibacillus sinensis]
MRHWLKQLRLAKGFTQSKVAELSGISRSYYADIERGTANAGGSTAKSIADVLGFDMSLFFAEIGRVTRQKQNKSA